MAHGLPHIQHPQPCAHACYHHPHPTLGTSRGGGPFLMPSQQRLHQPWARVGFAHACGRASGTHVGTWGGGGVPEGHHTWRAHASGHAEHAAATCARCSVTYVCARLRYIRVRTAPLHTCACLCICECCHGRRAAEGFGGGGEQSWEGWASGEGGGCRDVGVLLLFPPVFRRENGHGRFVPPGFGRPCARSPHGGLPGRQDAL